MRYHWKHDRRQSYRDRRVERRHVRAAKRSWLDSE